MKKELYTHKGETETTSETKLKQINVFDDHDERRWQANASLPFSWWRSPEATEGEVKGGARGWEIEKAEEEGQEGEGILRDTSDLRGRRWRGSKMKSAPGINPPSSHELPRPVRD